MKFSFVRVLAYCKVHKCVESIEEIPKLAKRNGLDFIISNKVVMVIHYVKEKTLIEIDIKVKPNSLLRS